MLSTATPAHIQTRINVHTSTRLPKSAAERWAVHVVKFCQSEDDLKTLRQWARYAGISYSSLCESCRLVDVRPHDARDFARALRALMHASIHSCRPEVLLDVSDRRTLTAFLGRAGGYFRTAPHHPLSLDAFVKDQGFILNSNLGLLLTMRLLDQPPDSAR